MTSLLRLPHEVQHHVRYLEEEECRRSFALARCWASEGGDGRQCDHHPVDDLGLCGRHREEIVG